ncbi:lipoyl(octanoyl) transferase LipB [Thiomicrospira sp. WB1]|uniref:lipoyl(octanoyl) transferase LipB n=1 Tax=Thiomicrospira sp. WB1 TaxID=1685380 RepID=UPI0007485A51|nr:lipoyl(octanoyl) transferase LipB [Thiomicrospira sp. WB1]KUJ71546.1 octanoyltransferase [Thiomicrospira sp. WB1]
MSTLQIRYQGEQPYLETWQAMRRFTDERTAETPDELWLVSHPPVYTQGLNGDARFVLPAAYDSGIPIVDTDRGGQITYHGPGQIIGYLLLDLKRHQLGVRALVSVMESILIEFLAQHGIDAHTRPNAPGVYVHNAKIASLGLKVRRGRTYHGWALNYDMDLTPFHAITPCGLHQTSVTQVRDCLHNTPLPSLEEASRQLAQAFVQAFRSL